MRMLLLELRPGALADVPLPDLLRQLADAAVNRAGLPVEVAVEGVGAGALPAEVQEVVYRVAQEALNNVARHAGATHARLVLGLSPDGATLEVADDGVGFVPGAADASHLGLRIMRERSDAIGAALAVDSAPGRGTRVALTWPAPAVESEAGSPR
jgi:signal transduction histidine kinase